MKRIFTLVVLLFFATLLFAQTDPDQISGSAGDDSEQISDSLMDDTDDREEFSDLVLDDLDDSGGTEEPAIPQSILNNRYYLESVRLTEEAREAFETGDYDASAAYAEEAAEYARRSDEYVAMRLADDAIARAHSRFTWAGSVGAAARYPDEYRLAETAYNEALDTRGNEEWGAALAAAERVLAALVNVKAPDAGPAPERQTPGLPEGTLPAQYTVRRWNSTGDCFWNIAGWSWVYGDPHQWRVLYEANKDKIPNPNNPNLIEPGTVLDIPSLRGEVRAGMWGPAGD
ncbi:MAG: LysM peptidoglycan-binding domain-containing protein [Treponema sp.]|jgi:tetratricopeptide (TPR) repeat protein|nr:LysM peptidoglycan-binding domain-containing protein [Treponema sp.]